MNKIRYHEVVRVDSPEFLVSAEHHACRYETRDGSPLTPGFYLVLGQMGRNPSFYGPELQYRGPLATLAEAQRLQTSVLTQDAAALNSNVRRPSSRLSAESTTGGYMPQAAELAAAWEYPQPPTYD